MTADDQSHASFGDVVDAFEKHRERLAAEHEALLAENQQLRDALKRIGDDTDPLGGYRGAGDFARSILREALAGDAE